MLNMSHINLIYLIYATYIDISLRTKINGKAQGNQ